jgi:hypothetical protein
MVGATALVSVLSLLGSVAPAGATVFGPDVTVTEDAVDGIVYTIGGVTPPSPPITIASDGEVGFDPFGAGFDTSDGIQLTVTTDEPVGTWALDGVSGAGWQNFQTAGFDNWVLPGDLTGVGCGAENEPTCEPVPKWDFTLGGEWADGTAGNIWVLEPDGNISDHIILDNSGPNGEAAITFFSDVPEPSTWAMMLLGFAGLAFAGYRSRGRTAALAV